MICDFLNLTVIHYVLEISLDPIEFGTYIGN